jgi:hypothetical protein
MTMSLLIKTLLLSVIAAGATAACAKIDIEQARKLSSGGVTSSTALQSEAKAAATRATAWHEGRVFYLTIFNDGKWKEDEDPLGDEVAKLLRARANALGTLVAAYKSFQALTDYDAAQETEKAASDFLAATNDLVAKINEAELAGVKVTPVNPQVAEGLNIAFGLIASEVQKAKIKKTSVALRTGVAKIAEALEAERKVQSATRVKLASERQLLTIQALQRNFVSYDKAARDLLGQFDLDLVKDLDPAIRKDPAAQEAIKRILIRRGDAERAGVEKSYEALIGTLGALVEQHKALEAGKPVDLATIMKFVEQVEDYYRRIKGAAAPAPAAQ